MAERGQIASVLSTVLTAVAAIAALAIAVVVVRREFLDRDSLDAARSSIIAEPVEDWEELVADGNRIGPEDALVTIVEFGDFQCPACGRFHNSMDGVFAKYPGDIALIYRQLPLVDIHPVAFLAAKASLCAAEQQRFTRMHDVLFRYQEEFGERSLLSFIREAGIPDSNAFDTCLRDSSVVPEIDRDVQLARSMRLRGTPTVIINGLRYAAAPDSERLDRLVTQHRQEAIGND